jgi:UDP-N-acetylmuramate dehydrogenase
MTLFDDLESIVKKDYPLAKHTWYGLGGPADYFLTPRTTEQLAEAAKRCTASNVPVHVLGFGSNLLISDEGVRGAVIKLESEQFSQTEFDGQRVIAWAGAELSKLVLVCTQKGLSGIESLTGIPGSVGGAVRMNAGGSFGDIGSVVESVTLMDNDGNVFEKSKPELVFDYRCANITAKYILSAAMRLSEADPEQILRTVKETWMYKKNNQPLNTKNAGCIFKNPPGMAAGAMIDRAGLKGRRVGGATVSEKHANFIVAGKDCKSRDVLKLIDIVKDTVRKQFNVELELEIEVWK